MGLETEKKKPQTKNLNKKKVGRDRKRGFLFSFPPIWLSPPPLPPSPFLLISKTSDCTEKVNKGFWNLSFLCMLVCVHACVYLLDSFINGNWEYIQGAFATFA